METFISQGDGDGEDGVGSVLIKTSFAVSSKQSQGPAPTDAPRHKGTHQLVDTDFKNRNATKDLFITKNWIENTDKAFKYLQGIV